jgi:vancomycin permeability regulator SanA
MKNKSITGRTGTNFLIAIIALLVLDLFLLLFLKYKFNHLALGDFSISAFGNIFNIGFTLLNITGVLVASGVKKISPFFNKKPVLVLLIISLVIHLIILFYEYFHIGAPKFLAEIAPTLRIYYMYLFILSQLIQFYILSLVLSAFFMEKKVIYLKAAFKTVFIAVVLVLFTFFYSVLKNHGEEKLPKGEYDTGVILGAAVWQGNKPSPIFQGRINKAYTLYEQNIIKNILVTGSNAPGEKSEAKTAADYLKKKGVEGKDILIEEKSSNTVEQIAYLKRLSAGKEGQKKLVIISDEFHLVRALEISAFFNITAESSSSEYDITSDKLLYYRLRESAALILFWLFAV